MKKSFDAKTLIYPTPVWLIGTYDQSGKPNAAAIAHLTAVKSEKVDALSIR